MKLILDRMDLRPECEDASCSSIRIHHFKQEVQEVVAVLGRATFREFDGSSYQAVFAPPLMTWPDAPDMQEIGGKLVAVQSCWLNSDGELVANVQVIDGKDVVHSQQIRLRDGRVVVSSVIPFKRQGRQMSPDEFEQFLNANYAAVFSFIKSLLPLDVAAELTE